MSPSALPPPPAGYTVQANALPPPPAGYKLDAPSTQLPALQQPEGSGGKRFVRNLWDKSVGGAGTLAKAAGGVAASAIPGLSSIIAPGHEADLLKPAGQVVQGITQSHIDQAKKTAKSVSNAVDAIKNGDYRGALNHYTEAFGHAAATAVPALGPAAAAIGEQAGGDTDSAQMDKYGNITKSGKAPDIAGAAGGAAGLIGSVLAPEAVAKVAPKVARGAADMVKVRSTLNPVEQGAVDWAQGRDIHLSPGTKTGNKFVQAQEALTQNRPFGATSGAEFRRGTEADLQRTAGELSDGAHPRPATAESIGRAVPAQMDQTIAELSGERDAAYEAAWQARNNPAHTYDVPVRTRKVPVLDAAGKPTGQTESQPIMAKVNMPVDVRDLKAQAAPLIEEMSWMPKPERAASEGYTALQKLSKGPDFIPAWAAEKGLSGLKTMARLDEKSGVRNAGQGIAAGLIPDLQDAIDAAVANTGEEAMQGLQRGRTTHAQIMDVEDIAKQLRDKEPVRNFGRLVQPKDTGIGFLRQVQELAPDQMPPTGRAWVQQQMDRATREGGFSKTQGLLNDWRDLGPQTKQILFPDPKLRASLDNFFKVADMSSHAPNPSGTALVAGADSWNPGKIAAGYLGSKLFFTPKGISLLTDSLGAKTPGAAALAAAKIRAMARTGNLARLGAKSAVGDEP